MDVDAATFTSLLFTENTALRKKLAQTTRELQNLKSFFEEENEELEPVLVGETNAASGTGQGSLNNATGGIAQGISKKAGESGGGEKNVKLGGGASDAVNQICYLFDDIIMPKKFSSSGVDAVIIRLKYHNSMVDPDARFRNTRRQTMHYKRRKHHYRRN